MGQDWATSRKIETALWVLAGHYWIPCRPTKAIIQMPEASHSELILAIHRFIDISVARKHPLVEWQWLLGWINLALNAFPLLKPGLSSAYVKISGKEHPHAPVYLNKQVCADLTWVANAIDQGSGISYVTSIIWDINDAHLIIFCDACLSGLAFCWNMCI
jgi:hypothetical protein